jgi:hypothetical protein
LGRGASTSTFGREVRRPLRLQRVSGWGVHIGTVKSSVTISKTVIEASTRL